MTLTAFPRSSETAARPSIGDTSASGAPSSPVVPPSPAVPVERSTRDADGLAVASFVLGLVGLLVMNLLLGPAAIVMAIVALARSTTRRGRALLGLALGIADLAILAFLVTGNGVVAWNFGG
ncbi:DUF4190 domain-containing protein [Streptomyces sp. NBC_01022]|uniref:DUF4190 domain-containing protein n=1 Tax=Streptomyces sp. NBC_01022 TaxID=2903723 RepID=UPI002DDA54B3|nr:DUF4190 domain-containing protein [Streptomyces sp. NBC_01022]WRZ84585.1 DUF4190 domain-containing protein [Streptomyces sp. NBC_01022]